MLFISKLTFDNSIKGVFIFARDFYEYGYKLQQFLNSRVPITFVYGKSLAHDVV